MKKVRAIVNIALIVRLNGEEVKQYFLLDFVMLNLLIKLTGDFRRCTIQTG